jgi:hypothetical protein
MITKSPGQPADTPPLVDRLTARHNPQQRYWEHANSDGNHTNRNGLGAMSQPDGAIESNLKGDVGGLRHVDRTGIGHVIR